MNKLLRFVAIFVAVSFVACAATTTRRTVKEGWRDNMITSKVKWNMGRDDAVKERNMHVTTWRGTVTLTGRTVSEAEKAKAEEIARNVKYVKEVRNYIDVVGASVSENKVAEQNKAFSKPAGKYNKVQEITLPTVDTTTTATAKTPTTQPLSLSEPAITESTIPVATSTKSVEPSTKTPAFSEMELTEKTSTGRENAVSHEIKKELAMTTEEPVSEIKTMPVDDVTLQAEQELKELKAKKKRR